MNIWAALSSPSIGFELFRIFQAFSITFYKKGYWSNRSICQQCLFVVASTAFLLFLTQSLKPGQEQSPLYFQNHPCLPSFYVVDTLKKFDLGVLSRLLNHLQPGSAMSCPWCQVTVPPSACAYLKNWNLGLPLIMSAVLSLCFLWTLHCILKSCTV